MTMTMTMNNIVPIDLIDNLTRDELIELINITNQWYTEKDHKFYLYTPNPVMELFHKSKAKTRVLFGGNRSGKTYALVMELAMQFTGECPPDLKGVPPHRLNKNRRIRLCTIDYPNSFAKIIWNYIQILIPPSKISDVLRDQGRIKAITNDKGGFIEFMQYEQDVKKFQGSSRHIIAYDEEPPKSIRDENLMRLVDTDGEECFSLTPVSEIDRPVLWIYDELYDKSSRIVEKVDGVINDVTVPGKNPNIHCFFANIYDNVSITKEAADRILSSYPNEERIVREKGHFMFMSGRVYKQYSDNTHLIPPFEWWKRSDLSLYVAIDSHPRTPTAVLFAVADKHGAVYIVDEMFEPLSDIDRFCSIYKYKLRGKTPAMVVIDPSAFITDPTSGQCLAYLFMDKGLGNPIIRPGSKDLASGIIRVNEYLNVDKISGKPKLFISNECNRFRYEITHYSWGNWRKDTAITKGEKQRPMDKDDHMMECLYRIILLNPCYHDMDELDEDETRGYRRTGGYMYASGYR